MRSSLALVIALAACGDGRTLSPDAAPATDALPDAPPDPFAGKFDDPSDFPRTNCTPGSLAGFSHVEAWPDLRFRTDHTGELAVYVPTFHAEERVPHLLTANDLLVRVSRWTGNAWELLAVDVCGVDPDGTLRGAVAFCYELDEHPSQFPCTARQVTARPLRRIAGEGEGEHLVRLGEIGASWPGWSSNVRVAGDIAYVSRFEDGLRIVSVANPAAPVELGHIAIPGDYANDLKVVQGNDGRRYVLTASYPCNIIDVTDPATPQLAAQLPFSAHSVFVEGQTAYLVDGGSPAVDVWNLALPRAPVKRVSWSASPSQFDAWHDLYVEGGIAYLSESRGSGLVVVDFRNPTQPKLIGEEHATGSRYWHSPWRTTVAGRPIVIHGDEGNGSGLRVLDADPASPTYLATLGAWHLRDEMSIHNVMAIGARAYIAHYRDGVRVLDLSTPAAPAQVGYYNTWIEKTGSADTFEGAFGIDLDPARRRIYVADAIRGLIVLEGDTTVFP